MATCSELTSDRIRAAFPLALNSAGGACFQVLLKPFFLPPSVTMSVWLLIIAVDLMTGDDPKDVKARLKVWAQAVALASASRLGS
jgi:hypothetical protein